MWLYRIQCEMLGSTIGLYWRLRMKGAVSGIPADGPLLVAANHASFLDPWFVSMAFPRRIRWLTSDVWYHKSKVWRAFFRSYGTLPVTPGDPRATIDSVCQVIGGGMAVGIFPEGRVSDDGRLRRFRSGLYRIASRTDAPVVPVGIRGAFDSLPRNGRFPRPCRVTMSVGKPILASEACAGVPSPIARRRAFDDRLLRDICRLSGQEERLEQLLAEPASLSLSTSESAIPAHAEAS